MELDRCYITERQRNVGKEDIAGCGLA